MFPFFAEVSYGTTMEVVDETTNNDRVVDTLTPMDMDTNVHNVTDLDPIMEYVDEPLLPLTKACAPLTSMIYNLWFYVQTALDRTPEQPANGLTIRF